MSLKLKISLLVSTLLTVVIGGLVAVLIYTEGAALRREFERRQLQLLDGLVTVCQERAITQLDILLANYLRSLKANPAVVAAMFVADDGKVLGHTDPAQIDQYPAQDPDRRALQALAPAFQEYSAAGTPILEVDAPVKVGPSRVGTARLLLSRRILDEALEAQLATARRRLLELALPVLLAGFLGAFALTALMVRPVSALVRHVRLIAQGRLDQSVPVLSSDELGWLAREFNVMAGRLSELDQMKQDFVSSVTHDLKSPLTAIRMAAELVLQEVEKVPQQRANVKVMADYLFIVRSNVERLAALIASLLEVAKIETGVVLDEKEANLEELCEKVVRSFKLIASQKGLDLRLIVDSAVSNTRCDPEKIERALANLVGNAIKFTQKGQVTVTVSDRGAAQQVSVSDTGPGIPERHMSRLFTKFYRVPEKGGSSKIEGTGLGLTIVKGLVEAHGGAVSVQSVEGRGTTFTVTLPKRAVAAGAAA